MISQDQSLKLKQLLVAGVEQLNLNLKEEQITQLLAYLGLLVKWNSVYNLTSVRDPEDMVRQHLLDTLAAVSVFAAANSILDVGAGGGLPGIVVAIVYPKIKVALIDTVTKKTAFLTQVKAMLGLHNVTVYTGRVEQLVVPELFDVITSRAFSELANFVNWSGHCLAAGGQMVAMKGQLPNHEIEVLPAGWAVTKIQSLMVPGLEAQRHLLWLERVS
jgi:16S rRNA (guanine527-N7)-methyltransferase